MQRSNTLSKVFSFAAALALIAAPALFAGPVADVHLSGAGVEWAPAIAAESFTLIISGPEGTFTQEFAGGEIPSFSIYDAAGYNLADGSYTWELRATPAFSVAERNALVERDEDRGLTRQPARGNLTQSGYFRIAGGAIVQNAAEPTSPRPQVAERNATPAGAQGAAGIAQRDQVIADDLIVDGSICAGFDCVNGESFGFDTLRLKENNLRIKFQDTSSSASFPTNDWQLTANDTSNGGANKFSIDDIDGGRTPFTVEAGAPSHSLYVDDAGNLGLNTSTPVVEVHVVDGDSPTLRLEQNGSSGFTPQTWDIAGNETNFFVRDATNGSKLPLRIRPSAPSNSLYVNTNGDVGLGDSSPEDYLDIVVDNGNGGVSLTAAADGNSPQLSLIQTQSGGQTWRIRVNDSGRLLFVNRITDQSTVSSTPLQILEGSNTNLLVVGGNESANFVSNRVTVNGELYVGTTPVPDYVFEPDYLLPSIEEQAEYMMRKKHLPAVGGAIVKTDGSHAINVGAQQNGILEELEKAHLYIVQLNDAVKAKDALIQNLAERLEKLEAQADLQ